MTISVQEWRKFLYEFNFFSPKFLTEVTCAEIVDKQLFSAYREHQGPGAEHVL